jgi:hypothetical protein
VKEQRSREELSKYPKQVKWQLSELTAGNKSNVAFGVISAGVVYEMNKDKSKGEQVYRIGEDRIGGYDRIGG